MIVKSNKTLHSDTGDLTIQAWVNETGNPGKWTGAGGVVFKQGAYQWCVKNVSQVATRVLVKFQKYPQYLDAYCERIRVCYF